MYIERIFVYTENVPVVTDVGIDFLASISLEVMKIPSL